MDFHPFSIAIFLISRRRFWLSHPAPGIIAGKINMDFPADHLDGANTSMKLDDLVRVSGSSWGNPWGPSSLDDNWEYPHDELETSARGF